MATSFYQAIPEVIEHILVDQPASILDIGIGFGKYGVLLREVFDIPYERYFKENWTVKIDGVEGYKEYSNPIHDFVYDNIYYENILNIINELEKYDTVLLIDVLEHFEKEEGKELIKALLHLTNKSIVISTPLYPAPQGDYLSNSLEHHKSQWSVVDFKEFDFNYKRVEIGGNGANLFKVYPRANSMPSHDNHNSTSPLKLGYILPHRNLTGGLKILLQQMKEFKYHGHEVHAVFRGEENTKVIPDWYDLTVDKEILVPTTEHYTDYVKDCDLVIVGWYEQIPELLGLSNKVVYLEQGHEKLFGDIPNIYEASWSRNQLKAIYQSEMPIISVSNYINEVLYNRFEKESYVIHNGIDTDFYSPPSNKVEEEVFTILLVGNPYLKFKGFDVALYALRLAWGREQNFKVVWISQQSLESIGEPFPLQNIVNPPQDELRDWYQKADLLLFTSWYEGFGMPPLEAMSCGTPVISTKCGGVEEYANEENALLVAPGDSVAITDAVLKLLNDGNLRQLLSERGRETAIQFNLNNTFRKYEGIFRKIVNDTK